jgi:hypothetical protein
MYELFLIATETKSRRLVSAFCERLGWREIGLRNHLKTLFLHAQAVIRELQAQRRKERGGFVQHIKLLWME